MPNDKMGFEGQLFYGAPGSTGTTLLENTKDITVTRDNEKGNTTRRGNSSKPPMKTESVTSRSVQIEFVMLNDETDTALEALRVASANGTAVALRGRDYAAGKGPDGDFTLSDSDPWPLDGEQVITFTASPTRDHGRDPETYV